ncbi:DUF6283 family protein [Dactylosporangium matsuzakiense]|uniref:Uncharacterized protein n=1 Tax=Dactylosporangium matsuzakiense TaxID=53360 RepID=A0A9W6KRW0_9ACTN|nr:DUF6283 family protein [Dactylosporangium matsuzakiense]UWZ44606.1 hypothetical protein Dmats_45945 [Dactylosporangium matsuzakiense]GLL05376.1 hypothetical protein GCM10017581_071230 [Dactylosporangium matsuzakiense]
MGEPVVLPHRGFPWDESLFRRDNSDNPAAKFPAERWAELSKTVRDPATRRQPMPGELFGCHKGAPGTREDLACAGWLATVGADHVGGRLDVLSGRLPLSALEPGAGWPPLYETQEDGRARPYRQGIAVGAAKSM